MRVASKSVYDTVTRNLGRLAEELTSSSRRVSTGKRIELPSDDPAGLVQVLGIKSALSQLEQMERNISMGKSWIAASESALTNVQDILSEAKALSVQMASATATPDVRRTLAKTVDGMLEHVVALANTSVNGRYLFAGTRTETAPFVRGAVDTGSLRLSGDASNHGVTLSVQDPAAIDGDSFFKVEYKDWGSGTAQWKITAGTADYPAAVFADTGGGTGGDADGFRIDLDGDGTTDITGAVAGGMAGDGEVAFGLCASVPTYVGNANAFAVSIGRDSTVELGIDGSQVFGNLFATLEHLKQALEKNDTAAIQENMGMLDTHFQDMSVQVASIGSKAVRMDTRQSIIEDLQIDNIERRSRIEDVDFAKAVMELKAKELAYQAALNAAAKVLDKTLVDYL